MISVFEVVVDPDMIAPQPFTILRSTDVFVAGGVLSTTTSIPMFGPVQQASDKEVSMLPEADRVGSIRSFWSTQPLYVTRGYAPVPGVHGEAPVHASGLLYFLSAEPPADSLCVYSNGLLLATSKYTVSGTTLTLQSSPTNLYVTWSITVSVQPSNSDQIQYTDIDSEVTETYRVLRVYRDPGGGYWKAYGTRLAAA